VEKRRNYTQWKQLPLQKGSSRPSKPVWSESEKRERVKKKGEKKKGGKIEEGKGRGWGPSPHENGCDDVPGRKERCRARHSKKGQEEGGGEQGKVAGRSVGWQKKKRGESKKEGGGAYAELEIPSQLRIFRRKGSREEKKKKTRKKVGIRLSFPKGAHLDDHPPPERERPLSRRRQKKEGLGEKDESKKRCIKIESSPHQFLVVGDLYQNFIPLVRKATSEKGTPTKEKKGGQKRKETFSSKGMTLIKRGWLREKSGPVGGHTRPRAAQSSGKGVGGSKGQKTRKKKTKKKRNSG